MERFHRAAESDGVGNFGARKLPRIGESQPVLWIFVLPAILDRLAEQAMIVADAIAICSDLQCRHAFHEAGRKPSQAAIAERGIRLHFGKLVEIDIEAGQSFADLIREAKIGQRVHKKTPDQEFE